MFPGAVKDSYDLLVKTCPTCGFNNPVVNAVCESCGVSVVSISPTVLRHLPEAELPVRNVTTKCPECSQSNSANARRCVYCDAPLDGSPNAQVKVQLTWPWGTEMLTERLLVGRESPASKELIENLTKRGFDNISRSHAEFEVVGNELYLTDLASANGTFVNGSRIPPNNRVKVLDSASVRFGSNLAVQVSIREGDTQ